MHCVTFCVRLLKLSIIFLRFMLVTACVNIHSCLCWITFHCTYTPHFVYPFTLDGNPQLSFFWEKTLFFFLIFTTLCWFQPHNNANQRKYTYIPSLLSLPSTPSSHPSRLSQSTGLSSPCYTAASH